MCTHKNFLRTDNENVAENFFHKKKGPLQDFDFVAKIKIRLLDKNLNK